MEILEQGSLELIGKECFGSLADVSLQQSFGRHGFLKAVVWLKQGIERDENSKQWEDMPIVLIPRGKTQEPIFSGIVTSSAFSHINGRPVVKLEAYDILFSEELYHYFKENVYGKGEYENPIGQPVLNFYYSRWISGYA